MMDQRTPRGNHQTLGSGLGEAGRRLAGETDQLVSAGFGWRRVVHLGLLLVASLFLAPARSLAGTLILDDFAYATTNAARAAWTASGAPAVAMATGGEWGPDQVVLLPCDFATRSTRCTWDRAVNLNLASYAEFALEIFAPNPGAISSFTLYFKSGAGWYGASATLSQAGWQTLRFAVSDFIPEGTPAGWSQITGIRLSPWKGAAQNTYLAVRQLRAFTPTVLLVRDPQSSNPDIVQQTIDRHLAWLGGYNISCGVITRTNVEAGLLLGSKLAILPYNEAVSETEMTRLESFVAAGGKVMVYYLLPLRLPALLGVTPTGWTAGDFAAWKFSDPTIPNLPTRVFQSSWNITTAVTNGLLNSRVTAKWENSLGQDTGKAAWLASDHGFFMSHVLLGDDADQKSYALLCLIGSIVPEVWPAAAAGAIDQIGRVGPYLTYNEAVAAIRQQGSPTLRSPLVESELTAAETNRISALAAQVVTNDSQAIFSAQSARAHLRQAFLLSLKPVAPEFRAFWEHHATGPYPGNWAASAAALATNQFNAVFPNMLWGGLAHYNSAYLPHSAEFNQYGDQITACVNAAHARGLQVHVWKVNWNLEGAPQSFINDLRAANRTQVSRTGATIDWLCPSHPDNFALETNAMLEVVRNYDVDGIHFDYIRYPSSDYCYCTGCRARFQSQTGHTVANWPADVLAAGTLRNAFLDWRRAQITRLVAAVYAGTKALKPAVRVSAAVFPNALTAFDGEGQDWRLWITNGIVDFLCPMDYTTDVHGFTNLVAQQLAYAGGQVPIYPGIGAFVLETDATLTQIQAARNLNTHGFIVFELSPASATNLLPAIGAGATAPDEPDTDNDLLPDSWEQRWFENLTTAGLATDADADGLNDRSEYIAGMNPTQSTPGLSLEVRWNGGQVEVSFPARAVDAPGYQNAARHYRLESTATLASGGVWEPVPG
ncbi:MAG: family 10 glycosylhydrolase, partial [Verrucomicrobia subdivision 3 bacterium]|nr:family 10 glycosylhydrolase [Limisphaerales bacterium]